MVWFTFSFFSVVSDIIMSIDEKKTNAVFLETDQEHQVGILLVAKYVELNQACKLAL